MMCSPMGRNPWAKPQGTEMDGSPVSEAMEVHFSVRELASTSLPLILVTPLVSAIFSAGVRESPGFVGAQHDIEWNRT